MPDTARFFLLDPEVKQEVIRRERDVDRAMTDSAQARQVASAFQQVVQPYMARINALGVHPMAAAQELFKADYVLTTATPAKRAEFMAKLISDYGVDIQELDRALSGGAPSAEQTQQTQLERMLEERMAPLQNFLSQQQQQAQYAQQQEFSALDRSIETMASDAKFPFFDEVREDMADVIEIQAKRGVAISLEQAYTRAIAMNPDVSQRLTQQLQQANSRAAASEGNLKAQRALAASKSVGGAPNGVAFQGANANDRRSTIEAAFSAAEGR